MSGHTDLEAQRIGLQTMNTPALVFPVAMALLVATADLPPSGGGPDQIAPPAPGSQAAGPVAGLGLIAGQVIDAHGDQPVSGAVVTLAGRGVPPQRVIVDPRGRFIFSGLPDGAFAVGATKAGYFGGAAGARLPLSPGRPVAVAAGGRLTDVTLRLWKYGAVTGKVVGDAGEPIAGLDVSVLRRVLVGGHWRLVSFAVDVTDDRGRYRIGGLAPGSYAVVARPDRNPETALLLTMLSPNIEVGLDVFAAAMTTVRKAPELDARVRNYPVTFYPGATTPDRATLVSLEASQERTGVDFHLKSVPVVNVSGTIAGADGPAEGLTLRLVPANIDAASIALEAASTACDSTGHFEFSGVTPGQYVVKVLDVPAPPPLGPPSVPPSPAAIPPLPATPTRWANVPVSVGASGLSGLSVSLRKGFVIGGRVEFNGTTGLPPPEQLAQINIRVEPANQPAPVGAVNWRGRVDSDGHFRTMGVPPGQYFLRVAAAPPNWGPQSAMIGGRDALDVPIQITAGDVEGMVLTLVDQPMGQLTGAVRDDRGESAVLVFPYDRRLWTDTGPLSRRLRIVRLSGSGAYTIAGLPPGEYFVAAVGDDVPTEWQDPTRLGALARRAARVRIEQAKTRTLDLQATRQKAIR